MNRATTTKEKTGPVGIDIGSYKTVMSCFDRTGPEVIPSELGDKTL